MDTVKIEFHLEGEMPVGASKLLATTLEAWADFYGLELGGGAVEVKEDEDGQEEPEPLPQV